MNSTCRADSEYSTTQLWCGPMVNSTCRADSEYSTTQLWCGPTVEQTVSTVLHSYGVVLR